MVVWHKKTYAMKTIPISLMTPPRVIVALGLPYTKPRLYLVVRVAVAIAMAGRHGVVTHLKS